jgi:hypothetical protein
VLEIDASRLQESSAPFWRNLARTRGRCGAALPKPNLAEYCVNWWNHVGQPTAATAVRRHVQPQVQIRADWHSERSACTYTLVTSAGFLAVTAQFVHGDWTWPALRSVDRRAFRPNARLNDEGRLYLMNET